jgi:hypothetical protein
MSARILALCVVASLAAGSPAEAGERRCDRGPSRTVIDNAVGAILLVSRDRPPNFRYFLCTQRSGRKRFIGPTSLDITSAEGLGFFRVARGFAAYELSRGGFRAPVTYRIVLRDLRTRRQLTQVVAFEDRPLGSRSFGDGVRDLELTEEGGVAWTGINATTGVREIRVADSLGQRVVDSGDALDLRSLRVSGTVVSWVRGGRQVRLRLDGRAT